MPEPTRSDDLQIVSAADFSIRQLADLMNRGFEGYVVPIRDTPERFAWRARFDHVDLSLSLVAQKGEEAVGLALLAPRGTDCRLAAMGVSRESRGEGVGRRLAEAAIEELEKRGYRSFVLEVVEGNRAAQRLYEGVGFAVRRRLVGYRLDVSRLARLAEHEPEAEPVPINPAEVAAPVAEIDSQLPWQLRSLSIATFGPEHRAFHLNGAMAVFEGLGGEQPFLHTLWVPPALRRQGRATRLLAAVAASHDAASWIVPARVPEGLCDDFVTSLGGETIEVSQVEMSRPLIREDAAEGDAMPEPTSADADGSPAESAVLQETAPAQGEPPLADSIHRQDLRSPGSSILAPPKGSVEPPDPMR